MSASGPGLLGLKVDVDTLAGYREGVASLLQQFDRAGVRATFFFSVGPDRSGVAIRRVFTQRGFVAKMIRNRAPATYGLKTMLYGTLLPAPLIVAADPGVVRAVAEAGHEVGVHGWDHIGWHDAVGRLSRQALRDQLARAFDALGEITGREPRAFAAPGWQCAPESLAYHDDRGLLYASDVRGTGGPFLPRLAGQAYRTVQLPTSLPTLDEMWGLTVHAPRDAAEQWAQGILGGTNVLTVHAEIEGMALPQVLPELLARVREAGSEAMALEDLLARAESARPEGACWPVRDIAPGRLPGRAGRVWCVGDEP